MSKQTLQTVIGVSFRPQAALQTASPASDIWRLSKLNAQLLGVNPVIEDDANEIGHGGGEFAENLYPSYIDAGGSIQKYISSQMAAWLFAFAFGKVTTAAAGTGGTKYTVVPSDVCESLELPSFSFIETIGAQCGTPTLDRVSVGNVLSDFTLTIGSGPGRQNSQFTANFAGCGKVTSPSGIVMPASALAENGLLSSSAKVNLMDIDYHANKNLISLELSVNNNPRLDQGFYPGSGVDSNGFAIRGRMERGVRALGLTITSRFDAGSTELDKVLALTTGAISFELTGAQISAGVNHGLKVTFAKVGLRSGVLGDDNGIVTVQTSIAPMKDPVAGVLTAEVTTNVDGIGVAE